jgi:hypothetical protein
MNERARSLRDFGPKWRAGWMLAIEASASIAAPARDSEA